MICRSPRKPIALLSAFVLASAVQPFLQTHRAHADDTGTSGGPQVEVIVHGGTTIAGETIVYPADQPAMVTAAVVTLAPGQQTGWHIHGVPVFGYILDGELTVDYGDLGTRVYRQGDGFLEAISFRHNGRNAGEVPVRVLAVFIGGEASRNTIAE